MLPTWWHERDHRCRGQGGTDPPGTAALRPAPHARVWARRHRGIVWLLWLHVAGIAAFAVARGNGLGHGLEEASLVALFALPAAHQAIGRRARSAAAVLGLITSSAVIVHIVERLRMVTLWSPARSGWPAGTSRRAGPS